MKNLFCTPEQGRRLKELLPELESTLVWIEEINFFDKKGWNVAFSTGIPKQFPINFNAAPALTLQELRDIVNKVDYDTFTRTNSFLLDVYDQADYDDSLMNSTAPELAEWVIARLEGKP
jgi:hypothetical protein